MTKIIVSMTTWSKRIGSCKPTLDSIINQTRKPDEIEINLDRDNFPNERKDIPEWLVQMENDNDNLHIYFQEHDMHCWEKLVPTIRRHIGDEYIDITLDCDVNYPPTYVEEIEKNMEDNDWLCSQWDDITQGQYSVWGPKAIEAFLKHVDDDLIENVPLDDLALFWIVHKYRLKRGKKIDAICEDRQQGYSFRRFFVDGYDEAELKDSTCEYPYREFVKQTNYLRMRGIV